MASTFPQIKRSDEFSNGVKGLPIEVEHIFDLETLKIYGINIDRQVEQCGITGLFKLESIPVYPKLIREFWETVFAKTMPDGTLSLVGYVLHRSVYVSMDTIARAIGCPKEGLGTKEEWQKEVPEGVFAEAVLKPNTDLSQFRSEAVKDEARIFNQVLNKFVLHKTGSKDSLSLGHKVLLCLFMLGERINLPLVIWARLRSHVYQTCNSKSPKSLHHSYLLSKIFENQGIYDVLDALPDEEKEVKTEGVLWPTLFEKSNLVGMKLGCYVPPEVAAESVQLAAAQKEKSKRQPVKKLKVKHLAQRKLPVKQPKPAPAQVPAAQAPAALSAPKVIVKEQRTKPKAAVVEKAQSKKADAQPVLAKRKRLILEEESDDEDQNTIDEMLLTRREKRSKKIHEPSVQAPVPKKQRTTSTVPKVQKPSQPISSPHTEPVQFEPVQIEPVPFEPQIQEPVQFEPVQIEPVQYQEQQIFSSDVQTQDNQTKSPPLAQIMAISPPPSHASTEFEQSFTDALVNTLFEIFKKHQTKTLRKPTHFPSFSEEEIFDGAAESHKQRRAWKALFLQQPPASAPLNFWYPLPEYEFEPRVICPPLYPKEQFASIVPPSQKSNALGPLVVHLEQKRFPARQIYPNLKKFPRFCPDLTGIDQAVIGRWSENPKAEVQTMEWTDVLLKRARSPQGSLKLFDSKAKWKKDLHPMMYGQHGDPLVDTLILNMLRSEFSCSRSLRSNHFIPSNWLTCSSKTKISFVPWKICPPLPLVDMNKDKDHKLRRNKMVLPAPMDVWIHPSNEKYPVVFEQGYWKDSEMDAAKLFLEHMARCNREASGSGLSDYDKAGIPTVGISGIWKASPRFFTYKDLWHIPCWSHDVVNNTKIIRNRVVSQALVVVNPIKEQRSDWYPSSSSSIETIYEEPMPQSPVQEVSSATPVQEVHPLAMAAFDQGSANSRSTELPQLVEELVEARTKAMADQLAAHFAAQQEAMEQRLSSRIAKSDKTVRTVQKNVSKMMAQMSALIQQFQAVLPPPTSPISEPPSPVQPEESDQD